jgi:cyclohexa-1,5-dienecarbonyl-CoA hydratase
MNAIRESTEHDGAMLRLTVAAGKGNVFTAGVMNELNGRLETAANAAAEGSLRMVLIDADGPHFSYGASVPEHTSDKVGDMLPVLRRLVLRIARFPVPVSAAVQGMCLGGAFEAVMPCHFIFAADSARFGVPEVRLGVFPPVAAALLPRRTSQVLAENMMLSGREYTAAELVPSGLIHAVHPEGELRERVDAWFCETLLGYSAAGLREAVRASRATMLSGLEAELSAREQDYLQRLMKTHDAEEGIRAFMERRKPEWRHA